MMVADHDTGQHALDVDADQDRNRPAVAALERHDLGGPEGVADDRLVRAGTIGREVRRLALFRGKGRRRWEQVLEARRQLRIGALPEGQGARTDEKRRDYEESLQDRLRLVNYRVVPARPRHGTAGVVRPDKLARLRLGPTSMWLRLASPVFDCPPPPAGHRT